MGWLVEREHRHALDHESVSDIAPKAFGAIRINRDLKATPEDPQRRDRPARGMWGKPSDATQGLCSLTSLASWWLGHR